MPSKKRSKKDRIHQEFEGLEMKINELGEIQSSFHLDQINQFLNTHLNDKKLNPEKDTQSEGEEE
ncbi:MAG: hypothetical protein IPH16_01750 [Haliscomenobacter sp.]|nr:hypothetical protein [Haliscomenobacter sp.]MBK7477241.1 hypothetical protein [Haliscomenobacter sp.]MBK8878071.1 hypothetical protein [Haliscomenobacter sp.]